jgi:hypothetical protein
LLAERAVRLYFFAVGCFVVAGLAIANDHLAADTLTWLPVLIRAVGMGQTSGKGVYSVRAEGAHHQWRRDPPGELSIAPVADERLGWVTGWAGAS